LRIVQKFKQSDACFASQHQPQKLGCGLLYILQGMNVATHVATQLFIFACCVHGMTIETRHFESAMQLTLKNM